MILMLHLLVGAVVAARIKFFPLAILLAFLSHYFLDSLPHAEYPIENIKRRKWKEAGPDFLKLTLDPICGVILILVVCYFTEVSCFVLFTAAFFAILPDILTVLGWTFPDNELLKKHFNLHRKAHFPENKKTPIWKGVVIELSVILLSFFFLLITI